MDKDDNTEFEKETEEHIEEQSSIDGKHQSIFVYIHNANLKNTLSIPISNPVLFGPLIVLLHVYV